MITRIKNWITTVIGTVLLLYGVYCIIWCKDCNVQIGTVFTIGLGMLYAKDSWIKKGIDQFKKK